MPEITTTDRYKSFILNFPARKAAAAMHVINATINQARPDGPAPLIVPEQINRALQTFQSSLSSRFNLDGQDIRRHLMLDHPATQIFRDRDGVFHAYSVWPQLASVQDMADSDVDYLIEVPVDYTGTYKEPPFRARITKSDMGNRAIIGWGSVIEPYIIEITEREIPLPADFDPERHAYLTLSDAAPAPALKAVIA